MLTPGGTAPVLLLAALLLAGCSAGAARPESTGIGGVQVVAEDPSHDHVGGAVEYDASPPVGGPHNERRLTHRPDVDVAPLAALKELSDAAREYVLVSPFEDLPRHGIVGMVQAAGDWWLDEQPCPGAELTAELTGLLTGAYGSAAAS